MKRGLIINNIDKMMNEYIRYTFQSSMYETPEFKSFCTKLKNAMLKDITMYYSDLEISDWSKGHFEVSGLND